MEFNLQYPTFIPEQGLTHLQKVNNAFRHWVEEAPHFYKKDNLEIIILKTPVTKTYIDVTHHGWRCPSMYNDTPPESGLGETLFTVTDTINIIMEFRSDDYSEQIYLKFLFSNDFESITILDGAYKGTILHLID